MTTRYSKHLPFIIFASDLLILNVALTIANLLTFHTARLQNQSLIFLIIVNIVWGIISLLTKSVVTKRPLVFKNIINHFLITLTHHLLFVFGILYFFKIHDVSRSEVIIGYSLFSVFIIFFRLILLFSLDYYRKKGYNHRKILIIGDKHIGTRLIRSFLAHPEYGYDLTNFIMEDEFKKTPPSILKSKILSHEPHEIFLCFKQQLNTELLDQLISFGDENSIQIKIVFDLVLNNHQAQLVNYQDIPLLLITSDLEVSKKIRFLKRSFDILFSLILTFLGMPVFILLYIITKVSSRGPAFYKQERIGRDEKPFYIYKFRSMYVNSEALGPQLSKNNDPRITKWGIIMRKTRLDELPQFWNVLKGEMSVVGPRPERQHFIEKIVEKTPDYKKLFCLKPGITSMGQVHYGYAENIDEMCTRLRYDLLYLKNINLNADLDIIYRTVKVMIQRKGK